MTEVEQLRKAVAAPCRRYPVRRLRLFGSLARNEGSDSSDVDLLVTFEPGAKVGLLMLARMQRELSELLGLNVDLVPEDGLKPHVAAEVLNDARVLFET